MAKGNNTQLCPFKRIIKTGTKTLEKRNQSGEQIENHVFENQLKEAGMLVPEKKKLG